jgi:cytochrome c-type biogenesis protein CcmH/NrfG
LDKTRRKGENYYEIGRKKLEEMGKADVKALEELAVQAVNVGKYEEAIDLWRAYIKFKPADPGAYICLGTAYSNSGNFIEARNAHAEAFRLAPNMPETLTNYVRSEMYLGNAELAAVIYEKSQSLEQADESTLFVMAVVYCCCRKEPEARAYFERLLQVPALNGRTGLSIAIYELLDKLRAAGQAEYASEVLRFSLANNYLDNDLHRLKKMIAEGNAINP